MVQLRVVIPTPTNGYIVSRLGDQSFHVGLPDFIQLLAIRIKAAADSGTEYRSIPRARLSVADRRGESLRLACDRS